MLRKKERNLINFFVFMSLVYLPLCRLVIFQPSATGQEIMKNQTHCGLSLKPAAR